MKRRRVQAEEMGKQLDENGQSQISLTDSDSRIMPVSGGHRTDMGYNVQVCVDAKHKLIVDREINNAVPGRDLLTHMAKRAKELLGVAELDVLADMGYYRGKEVKDCLQVGTTPYIPKHQTSASRKRDLFRKEDFHYDPERDCYWYPAEEKLSYRVQTMENGRVIKYYVSSACAHCSIKTQCTLNKDGHHITRWVDEDLLDEMEQRVQAHPDRTKMRKRLAEHPFGTIKQHWNQGHFLTRKLPNVRAEMVLTILA